MRLLVGTSGFGYKEWRGTFYPEKLASGEMLAFYATRFPAVELNSTFYRVPSAGVLSVWREQVPDGFRFTAKAPRKLTHFKPLAAPVEDVEFFLRALSRLGEKLGAVLFQLPPSFSKDIGRLQEFLRKLPEGTRAAFEFRNGSWVDEEVADLLGARGFALCALETDEAEGRILAAADWGYVKLRRREYAEKDLAAWLARIREQPWKEAYVFFKHEEEARGPDLARRLLELAAAS